MPKNEWVVKDPKICFGAPVVRGTRVPVKVVVNYLMQGYQPEKIVSEFPTLTLEAVKAIFQFVIRNS